MLGICLRVLTILGILLLILLLLAVGSVLLVLFFPLTYRIQGIRNPETFELTVRARWLFGLVRGGCKYPEPGRIRVKVLCFTLLDKGLSKEEEEEKPPKKRSASKRRKSGDSARDKKKGRSESRVVNRAEGRTESKAENKPEGRAESEPRSSAENEAPQEDADHTEGAETSNTEDAAGKAEGPSEEGSRNSEEGLFGRLASKLEHKTGKRIPIETVRALYDKIRKIWENISYYVQLLQEEETKLLLSDSMRALLKILRSMRPRRIRADIRFGTGEPDTTGYAYGAYCILSSAWGPGFLVTPDFEERVLEGELDLSGRITLWVMLVNGLKMYKLIRKLKRAGKKRST